MYAYAEVWTCHSVMSPPLMWIGHPRRSLDPGRKGSAWIGYFAVGDV